MLVLPDQFRELPLIASVSGGKDSTAMILALREAGLPFRAVFADTGWEAPETYAYLDMLRERVCPIEVVGKPGGMAARIHHRAGFPARMQRWCTRELKIDPLRAYHDTIGEDTVSVVGVRADESPSRAKMIPVEDDSEWGGWIWRPMLAWTIADVIAAHHRAGIPVNPLYERGHDRVGCFPCIFARKEEIALVAEHAPGRIDEIRALEADVERIRSERNAAYVPTDAKPVRYAHARGSFFQTTTPTSDRSGVVPIDDVVAWARTSRGGRQLPLLAEPPSGGCFRWGLCEPPSKDGE